MNVWFHKYDSLTCCVEENSGKCPCMTLTLDSVSQCEYRRMKWHNNFGSDLCAIILWNLIQERKKMQFQKAPFFLSWPFYATVFYMKKDVHILWHTFSFETFFSLRVSKQSIQEICTLPLVNIGQWLDLRKRTAAWGRPRGGWGWEGGGIKLHSCYNTPIHRYSTFLRKCNFKGRKLHWTHTQKKKIETAHLASHKEMNPLPPSSSNVQTDKWDLWWGSSWLPHTFGLNML